MRFHEVRALIPRKVFVEYKILCAQLDLSIPKQLANMIMHFVDIQKENIKLREQLEKLHDKK